jgi:hypothetical protein
VRAPRWFRLAAGFVSAAAPALAVPLAERMFVRPPSRRLGAAESEWAGDAEVSSLATPTLAGLLPRAELALTSGLGHREILRDPAVLDRVTTFFGRRD